jgi:hypothetical protein
MQPTRRGYLFFLIKIDPSLDEGIYKIPFTISGSKNIIQVRPRICFLCRSDALFCISDKDANGNISSTTADFGTICADLTGCCTNQQFVPTGRIRWSVNDFDISEFESIPNHLQPTPMAISI